jgi:hypothetical protein
MTAERITTPAARTPSGRTTVVLLDTDAGVWTLDHDGASYWPGGATELRTFGAELDAGLRRDAHHPDAVTELEDLDGLYELLATIADELEATR